MRVRYNRYGSGSSFSPLMRLSPAVKILLIANVASFFLGSIVGRPYTYFFGLVPDSVLTRLHVWQLATYLFLHGGFFHLFFNMFALWMFGSELESTWGTPYFLRFYFLTGVGAGVITVLSSFYSGTTDIPTIGASGAVFAVLMAYALTFPNRLIYLYFLFPVKAKYLMMVFFLIEFVASFRYVNDGIGHFTHLGGMVIAYFYLRKGQFTKTVLGGLEKEKRRRKIRVVRKHEGERHHVKREVDRVLDKISKEGIEKLTREEWDTLNRASKLMKPGEGPDSR